MNKKHRHEKPLVIKDRNGKSINNPNRITINQHIVPKKHILEWSSDADMVTVNEIAANMAKRLPAANPYFCAMRLWDQWTETKQLTPNERNYQNQLDLMKAGENPANPESIFAYYIMLGVRTWIANKERPIYPRIMNDISGAASKATLEENELRTVETGFHMIYPAMDEDSQDSARQLVKMAMSMTFIQWCDQVGLQEWKTIHSNDESFVLPDSFDLNLRRHLHILPVTPKLAMVLKNTYLYLEERNSLNATHINQLLIAGARKYYISTS